MTLTNLLLFLILVTLATYTFMPWKGINKGSYFSIFKQYFSWMVFFALLLFALVKLNLVT